jgi:hypothetical protein
VGPTEYPTKSPFLADKATATWSRSTSILYPWCRQSVPLPPSFTRRCKRTSASYHFLPLFPTFWKKSSEVVLTAWIPLAYIHLKHPVNLDSHYVTYMASVQYKASWSIQAFHLKEQEVTRMFTEIPGQKMSRGKCDFSWPMLTLFFCLFFLYFIAVIILGSEFRGSSFNITLPVYSVWEMMCYKFRYFLVGNDNFVFLIYVTSNSVELGRSWETASCAATQELPNMLWKPKANCRVHKIPPPVCILSEISAYSPTLSLPRSILILSTHLWLGLLSS